MVAALFFLALLAHQRAAVLAPALILAGAKWQYVAGAVGVFALFKWAFYLWF